MNISEANDRPVVVGITGASGAVLAQHTINALLRESVPVIASASRAARMVWSQEMSESFGAALGEMARLRRFRLSQPVGAGRAHRERDVSDAGHGDRPVQHGNGGGGRQRAVGQPDPQGGRRCDQGASSAGDRASGVAAQRDSSAEPYYAGRSWGRLSFRRSQRSTSVSRR